MEGAFPESLFGALGARGHNIERMEGDTYGNAGLIVISEGGASADVGVEPRNETSAGIAIAAGVD